MIKYFHYKPKLKCAEYDDLMKIAEDFADLTGSFVTSYSSKQASKYAADMQYQATAETNKMNEALAAARNALEYQMFNEANVFNQSEAQKSRDYQMTLQKQQQDYNSLGAQMQRAIGAKVNPAAVAGGLQTTSGIAGGAASASSVAPPSMVAAQMQVPDLSALQGIATAYQQFSQSMVNVATSRKIKEDTKEKITFNKYYDQLMEANVHVSRSQAAQQYATADRIDYEIEQIQETANNLRAQTGLAQAMTGKVDQERMTEIERTYQAAIQSSFAGAQGAALTRQYMALADVSEAQAQFELRTLASRVFGVQLDNAYKQKNIEYLGNLSDYYHSLDGLVTMQGGSAAIQFSLDQEFARDEREQGLSSARWNNSGTVRFLNGFGSLVHSTAELAQTYNGVRQPRAAAKRNRTTTTHYNRDYDEWQPSSRTVTDYE